MDFSSISDDNIEKNFSFQRRLTNEVLIWFNPNVDDDYKTITQFKHIVGTIFIFRNIDECINLLKEVYNERVMMILTGDFSLEVISLIHEIPQLHSIYLNYNLEINPDLSINQWHKVKGIFPQIESIYNFIKKEITKYKNDMISISVLSSTDTINRDLNQLDPSFMYSQLLKETLLEIKHDKINAKQEFIKYCRQHPEDKDLKTVNEFEKEYECHTPIWWYIKGSFIYGIINQALRVQDIEATIKIGFLMHDIHREIEHRHAQLSNDRHSFIVYRGQGLFHEDFKKMCKSIGGLFSFNSFLSTSIDYEVAHFYADCSRYNEQLTAILFQMTIDPTICSIPYTSLNDISNFDSENEILFSMHTVFRIDGMDKIDDRFWKVMLTLISDYDDDLTRLTKRIREEIVSGSGWHQLAHLLGKMGKFSKAQELYKTLLDSTSKDDWMQLSVTYNQLAEVSRERGDFSKALVLYNDTLELEKKMVQFLPHMTANMAITYNNIGEVYRTLGNNLTALSYYQKTCDLLEISKPFNRISFGTVYSNIGQVFREMGKYSVALVFYEKAFAMKKGILPSTHPDWAIIFNNIGATYYSMNNFEKALVFFEKTLEVELRSLKDDHPSLAVTFNNIGEAYRMKEDYTMSLSFYQKALTIVENCFLEDHPFRATLYSNMGAIYLARHDYSKSLELFQLSLQILKIKRPPKHPDLVTIYSHIGLAYASLKQYSDAMYFFQKVITIGKEDPSLNQNSLTNTYFHMAQMYLDRKKYRTAFNYAQLAMEIAYQIHESSSLMMKKYKLIFTDCERMVQAYPFSD